MNRPRLLHSALLLATFAVAATAGPSLSTVNPPYIHAGGPDATLSIGGSGFVAGSAVVLGGATLSTTYIDSTKLSAVLPASVSALSGDYYPIVRNPDGSASSPLYFDIQPVLTSVTPNSVSAGSPTTQVTVTGIGFVNGVSLKFVTASASTPIFTQYLNSTKVTAFINASLLTAAGAASIQVDDPTYPVSTTLAFTITSGAPGKATLVSMDPSSVAAGGPQVLVQVIGSGFVNGCTAQWNGTALFTTVFTSGQLSVQIPASLTALPGSGSITVVNPGAAASNALTFTVTPQTASVRSISPTSATAGGPAFTLTVNGGSLTGTSFFSGAIVQWNGTSVATTYVSSTQLTAQVPASLIASSGTANVTVVNPGAGPSPPAVFTILPAPPALASLSPSSINAGSAGFTLTLSGSNFAPGAAVLWNGSSLVTTVVSSTQLTAQVPANLLATAGTVSVNVYQAGVPASSALTFTVSPLAAATLAAISPSSVTAGSTGFTLTATGSGFAAGSAVQWNGVSLVTTFTNATQLTAQIPAGLVAGVGTASVRVTNPSGSVSNILTFTIAAAPPVLSSLSPTSTLSGGPAFNLTVNGSGFVAASQVQWNGAPLSTTFVSPNQLTAAVPAQLSPATASITVVNPGAALSNALTFSVTAPATPTISKLAPTTAAAGGPAFTLTVTGANFIAAATVTWNGVSIPTAFLNSTQLTAEVAASLVVAPGAASVSVSNSTGANGAAPVVFTIVAAGPAITSLSPAIVAAGGAAFTLTVNGSGFVSAASVQWNGSPLATTFVSATQLTAQVPATAIAVAGSASLTVLNAGSPVSNAVAFTISAVSLAQPVVQSVLNAGSYTNALAPGTWAAIFGTRLAVSTASAQTVPLPLTLAEVRSVTVGGVPAPLSYVSPGQINFVIPFEAAPGASVPIVVTTSDGASAPVNVTLLRTAPALFTQNAQGTGMALAFNASFQPITSVGSDVLILYAVGLGPTTPPASSVQGGASAEPLNRVVDQVQVFIGEAACQVLFAGLAPGFPGIYQLNVVPPAAPASNRLYIVENGVTSNVTTLPIPVGTNVANVQASIDGLYPASGIYAVGSGNKPVTAPVSASEMLNAGAVTVSFDIRADAQPFTVVAVGPGATALLQIDPAGGTWQGYVTSPTAIARVGDFSQSGVVVYDLLTGTPFPGDIIPLNRFDPIATAAASLLPLPNTPPTTPSPNAKFVYTGRPLMQKGHFSIGTGQTSDDLSTLYFGAFVNIGQPPPSSQNAEFLVFVDGMLVATKTVSFPVQ
jgi:uncharacterized protein (TIGR03437 family)